MWIRNIAVGLLAGLVVSAGGGCKKSEPGQAPETSPPNTVQTEAPAASSAEIIARIHWLGKKRLVAETNAAYFMSIWDLPESARLEAQTLDKLALAPWLLSDPDRQSVLTNYPVASTNYQSLLTNSVFAKYSSASLLRPLVEDLLEEESYVEITQATNQPGQLAMAIRLDADRAGLWETNLAAVLKSLTGAEASTATAGTKGWQLQITNSVSARQVQFTHAGDWTLIGLAQGENPLLADFAARVERSQSPFAPRETNFWVEANLDLPRVSTALACGWNLPGEMPRIAVSVIGDGENVRTRGDLDFPHPLPIEIEPWNIPTNLVHDPLIGFMAIRGIRAWLKDFKPWNDLHLGTPPNQAFFWAQQGAPWMHFMSLPSVEASNQVSKIDRFALDELDPMFASNPTKMGGFVQTPGSLRLTWRGIPIFSPTLDVTSFDANSFIVAGFFSRFSTNKPIPEALLPQVFASTNVIWYDWELTGQCLKGLTVELQLVRHLFEMPRLPPATAIPWLVAVPDKLGNSATEIKLVAPSQISVTRKSTVGLTCIEIEIFVDWLESPKFPLGLHTFSVPPPMKTIAGTGVPGR